MKPSAYQHASAKHFPSCTSQITMYICYKHQLVLKEQEKKKKNSLYGPFRSPLPFLSCTSQITMYICYKDQLVCKKKKKKKKNSLYGPNNTGCIVWAHLGHRCPSRRVHRKLQCIYAIKISQYAKRRRKKETHFMAQTTLDASFGPVQVTAALPVAYIINYNIHMP